MKLVDQKGNQYFFELSTEERSVLFDIVGLYPLSPSPRYGINRTISDNDGDTNEDQALLEEALMDYRMEQRQRIHKLFNQNESSDNWQQTKSGYRLELSRVEVEWLLQVLNDIRVGSWYALGCPEDHKKPSLDESTQSLLPYHWSMDACCYFQMVFLSVTLQS
ncbi:MAG TPA: hypothetical protein EYQ50_26205 [Verrucomicrobiales bacterium]|jgi:hypothetical protein|nr:hypothetical protein [Verrucomicrobiales bacterium]HIL71497.1 hypothetical protein [Verrucomicrobiota bacterium]